MAEEGEKECERFGKTQGVAWEIFTWQELCLQPPSRESPPWRCLFLSFPDMFHETDNAPEKESFEGFPGSLVGVDDGEIKISNGSKPTKTAPNFKIWVLWEEISILQGSKEGRAALDRAEEGDLRALGAFRKDGAGGLGECQGCGPDPADDFKGEECRRGGAGQSGERSQRPDLGPAGQAGRPRADGACLPIRKVLRAGDNAGGDV